MADEGWGIVANVELADAALRKGARVVVVQLPGAADRVCVRGISRGGRTITKWTRLHGLRSYRAAWVRLQNATKWGTREEAEAVAVRLGSAQAASSGGASSPSQ